MLKGCLCSQSHPLSIFSISIVLLGSVCFSLQSRADAARTICLYTDHSGKMVQTNSRTGIPDEYKASAQCFQEEISNRTIQDGRSDTGRQPSSKKSRPRVNPDRLKVVDDSKAVTRSESKVQLADPGQIELSGTIRRESMPSSIGRIQLRWPRRVEVLFGRTPVKAMAEAARTASRALKKGGFPPTVSTLDLGWEVVFLDADLPETQIPEWLITSCHPAWMVPPGKIYVVAQRVVNGCSGESRGVRKSVADSELATVLIHEIGHSVEYILIPRHWGRDRARAEGFATWFETYASDFSPVIARGSVKADMFARARRSFALYPVNYTFGGSSGDYARASMYFHAVTDVKRSRGLMEVYNLMETNNLSYFEAVEKRYGWSRDDMDRRIKKLLR